jgi:orotidine-5'-phosphate decarboxylase
VPLTRDQAVRRLAVALDASDRSEIVRLTRLLSARVGVAKIGLEAFTAHGPALVSDVLALALPVFLDLKLHDIPNTVERAARSAARLGVSMLTVHAAGGEVMLRAACAGASSVDPPAAVVAVTVLGIAGGAGARALAWAELAQACGCAGVVCSPREASALRAALGPRFVLVTPGVRPAGTAVADQRRVATPREAIAAGADLLVVGRPITAAADPAAAADAIVADMCSG